jgi:hypothetical protein
MPDRFHHARLYFVPVHAGVCKVHIAICAHSITQSAHSTMQSGGGSHNTLVLGVGYRILFQLNAAGTLLHAACPSS